MLIHNIKKGIAYGEKLLLKSKVLERDKFNPLTFNKKDAFILELDLADSNNTKLLEELRELWKDGEFTKFITNPVGDSKRKLYAISSNADNVSAQDVYGLADFKFEGDNAILSFLQAAPQELTQNRNIKSIGRSLLTDLFDYFKELGVSRIETFSRPQEKSFYKTVFTNLQEKASTQHSYTNIVINLRDDVKPPATETQSFDFYF